MGAGITITVNAVTAEAAANLVAFVNQTDSGLKRIENASATAAAGTAQLGNNTASLHETVGKTRKGFAAMKDILMVLGYESFPQVTHVVMATTGALKHLDAVGGSASISIGKIGTIAALLSAAVAATQYSFDKLWEAQNKTQSQGDEIAQQHRLLSYLYALGEQGKLSAKQIKELNDELGAKPNITTINAVRKKAGDLVGEHATDTELLSAQAASINQRIAEYQADSQGELTNSSARLLTDQYRSLAQTYRDLALAIGVEQEQLREKTGFDKDAIKDNKEWIALEAKRRDAVTNTAEAVQSAKKIEAEATAEKIKAIAADWRLTDAEKYRRIAALSTPEQKARLGPDPDTWAGQWNAAILGVQKTFGTLQQFVVGGVMNVIKSAVDGVSDAISGAIMGTKSWGQAFQQIGGMIVSMLIQMAIKAAIVALILTPLGLGFGTKGGALLGLGGAREGGGPVKAGVPYIVGERRMELFVPDQSGYIYPSVPQSFRNGGAAGAQNGGSAPAIKFIMVADIKEAALEAMASARGERIVVQHIDGRRLDLGLNT